MAKYRNTELTTRCPHITIYNPDTTENPGAQPMIDFARELVVEVAGERGKRQLSQCRIIYTQENINTEVPLVDPATDLPTGETFTYGEFYQYFYSVFNKASADQDAIDMAREQISIVTADSGLMP